ncbi:MAG: ATP-binding protein [Chlamydiales bacterium]|nr:ATP-binding protein [Chlamydiales bacterium]
MAEDLLKTLIEEFRETIKNTEKSTHRDYLFPEADTMIKVAVGMRRSGKTYFLYQTMRALLKKGVGLDQILFLNFEDDRMFPMKAKEMGKLIDAWYSLFPENHAKTCYLFLDEVQNVEGWPLVLRRLFDTKKLQIYVTGSSAKLLSKEISTSLRGRSLSMEILPFDFCEYLKAHHLKLPDYPMGQQSFDIYKKILLEYFKVGGFPGVQHMIASERLEALQSYIETVIFRDIVERHQIKNVALLKYFIQFLLKNVSSSFSINKFYNDIKSQGYKVGKDTLHTYLSYLEDVFLIFTVPIFTESLRKLQTTPKKIYGIDNGLMEASSFNLSGNYGKLLENQVYLDLRRRKKEIFYYMTKEGYEIDFVTRAVNGEYEILQVVWDKEDAHAYERELRALDAAKKELGFPGKIMDVRDYLGFFETNHK